jgi:hypothetical protein
MIVNKKTKTIVLSKQDTGYQIILRDDRFSELIASKITYTNKGFGIQLFKERFNTYPDKDELTIFLDDDQAYVTSYVGIWKFIDRKNK